MQKGQLIHRGKSWLFRYWKNEVVAGQTIRKRVCEKIADFNDLHRTEQSVRPIAGKILLGSNEGKLAGSPTIQNFVESKYIPHIKAKKRPSTANGYINLYRLHVQPRIAGVKLATFETSNGQKLLDQIARENPKIAHRTLIHIKSLMSGIFSYARREGDYKGANPWQGRGAIEMEGKKGEDTVAYTLDQVMVMMEVLKELEEWTPLTAVTVAAFVGLSLSELRGLRFEDVYEDHLKICNSYWRQHEGPTKTPARKAAVPLLPFVKDAIDAQQLRHPGDKFVFEGPMQRPLDLATMGSKRIKPALEGKVEWCGWHPFRRGLATNLHSLGVQDKTIQAILRHANVAITQQSYIKTLPQDSIEAMKKLANLVAAQKTT